MGFDLAEFRARGTVERAFAYAREKVESLGVFVLLIGNLGSHHTDVDVSSFRGFAIADKLAPFIVINDHDAKAAWSFTLFHELAHLWLGATGISGQYGESQLERFCNDVASSLLLRPHELDGLSINETTDERVAARLISEFASARLISRSMVTYRLLLSRRVTQATWRSLTKAFRDDWMASREAQRAKARQREGGADFYVVRRHRLGRKLLDVVGQSMQAGALTPTKAGLVLGVKPRNVAPLLHNTNAAAT
jgi:Zn-dependent peptidase ImmA (M78 family)